MTDDLLAFSLLTDLAAIAKGQGWQTETYKLLPALLLYHPAAPPDYDLNKHRAKSLTGYFMPSRLLLCIDDTNLLIKRDVTVGHCFYSTTTTSYDLNDPQSLSAISTHLAVVYQEMSELWKKPSSTTPGCRLSGNE